MSNAPAQLAHPSPGKLCPECGYDLHGITSPRCPECGLNVNDPNYSSIPWANRARIGRFTAFWKTAVLATFRPKKFAKAVEQPVDFSAANRFRWIVVALATLPAIVTVVVLKCTDDIPGLRIALPADVLNDLSEMPSGQRRDLALMFTAGSTLAPIIPMGVLVSFSLWTATAGLWFRPGGLSVVQQNRALAISRYICAPLAWIPLVGLGAIPMAAFAYFHKSGPTGFDWLMVTLGFIMEILLFAILVLNWWGNLRLLSMTTNCGWGRLLFAAIGIPTGWVLSCAIGMLVVPSVTGFITIIFDSLR